MEYEISYSGGRVKGTDYSPNTGPRFNASESEAREYLMRETHEAYIGGTGRSLSLWEIGGGRDVLIQRAWGCDCHTPDGCSRR